MTFTNPDDLDKNTRELGGVFAPKFDADGLITAIAIDDADGHVLMVAYMNAEALSLTIQTGLAHYFSRSRKSLWKKGESSGELQKLVEMRTDCDQDAIIIRVQQTGRGAACHTGRKSCFYRKLDLSSDEQNLIIDPEPPIFDPEAVYSAS